MTTHSTHAATLILIGAGTAFGLVPDVAFAGEPALATETIASGLNNATYAASPPGDASRIMVIEKRGVVRLIKDGALQPAPFLDLDALVPNETFNGLIGIAFHPEYATNGYFYLQHSRGTSSTDRIVIARYTANPDGDTADPASRDEILVLPIPASPGHHVGGWIGFGPDGFLYAPFGDGHTTGGETGGGARSQSLTSLWGKTLRLDVDGDDFPGDPDRDYAIPADNPYVGIAGDDEIWQRGLRNPYRACFDRATGDFWIADVGLFQREEVNFTAAGSGGAQNFGWNCAEGTLCTPNGNCACGADLTAPVFEYTHADGCSITGGAIYRGCAIPGLDGTFFYGDWCGNSIGSFRYDGGSIVDAMDRTAELDPPGAGGFGSILAVCEDAFGEILIVDGSRVHRIIPAGGIVDENGNGIADSCERVGDLDGDGTVGFADLLTMLAEWGDCAEPCPPCAADLDDDCTVGFGDVVTLLANWG